MREPLILTIAISTFNRSERLRFSLSNLIQEVNESGVDKQIEILVVDNCSTDRTAEYLRELASIPFLRMIRNSTNQGMLGNLAIIALRSRGAFVWCLGDDDHVLPGTVSKILNVLDTYPQLPLIYLNYAHKQSNSDSDESDFTINPISNRLPETGSYRLAEVLCANSNMMTAIYTLVLRRDYAVAAYASKTLDDPFTSLPSCVPSTCLALSLSPELMVYWMSEPAIAVDLRVSWIKFAPLWILDRISEMILRIEFWSKGVTDLQFALQEQIPGVEYWSQQASEDYIFPNSATFAKAAYSRVFSEEKIRQIADRLTIFQND